VGGPLLGLTAQPLVDTFPGPTRAGRVRRRRRRRHPLILTKSLHFNCVCLVASLALPLFLFRRSTSVHPRVAASLTHDARYLPVQRPPPANSRLHHASGAHGHTPSPYPQHTPTLAISTAHTRPRHIHRLQPTPTVRCPIRLS
jgi:hypothetical protein